MPKIFYIKNGVAFQYFNAFLGSGRAIELMQLFEAAFSQFYFDLTTYFSYHTLPNYT